MRILAFATLSLIYLSLTGAPALAQQSGATPHLQLHAVNPSLSLAAPVTNPLQAQIRQDYANQLMAQQRELLQQNSSGLTRQELAVGHELNNYTGPR
jgi:hypothetical protein